MDRRHVPIRANVLDADLGVVAYGHYGRPLLAFPSERGACWDYTRRRG
jgi:esterase/lipase superfamily enzyme